MDIQQSIKTCFKKFATFDGRASRSEYWWFQFFYFLVVIVAVILDGVLVGVGPGAACTSREVLGIGMPQVSATIETSHARNTYFEKTGRYVPIITDGGIRTGGDFSKAICAGANAVMIGSPFASTVEAPR